MDRSSIGVATVRIRSATSILGFLIVSLGVTSSHLAFAQDDFASDEGAAAADGQSSSGDNEGAVEVEALYDKYDQEKSKKREAVTQKAKEPIKEVTTLSELANLAPFSDVAVIQRRFLPRTGRFELTGSAMTSVNNPFFNNLGLGLRAAYHLVEKHGIEFQYMIFSNTRRAVTNNLEEKRDVQTTNLVTAKSYIGGAYKWTPVYGKITFLNRHIVPFDLYFTGGMGLTQTQKQGEPTFHFGTGQAFAVSKKVAIRWDVIWNFFQAEVDSVTGTGTVKTSHNDLFITLGASFFFPEATYR